MCIYMCMRRCERCIHRCFCCCYFWFKCACTYAAGIYWSMLIGMVDSRVYCIIFLVHRLAFSSAIRKSIKSVSNALKRATNNKIHIHTVQWKHIVRTHFQVKQNVWVHSIDDVCFISFSFLKKKKFVFPINDVVNGPLIMKTKTPNEKYAAKFYWHKVESSACVRFRRRWLANAMCVKFQ